MAEKPQKRAVRTFDFTAVPGGPHGEFPRQLVETLDSLVGTSEELEERLSASESAPARGFQRVKSVQETADPFEVSPDPDVHAPGAFFDDVSASGALSIQLPSLTDLREFYDLDEESPHYYFLNTSAQAISILAGTDTTIEVGPTAGSVATFKLSRDNEILHLVLTDDRWRAASCLRQTGVRVKVTQFDTTTGVDTPISWTSVDSVMGDPDAFWSAGAPTRVTIPSGLGGLYSLEVSADFDQNATGHRRLLLNHKNSAGTIIRQKLNQGLPPAANACIFGLPYINRMAPGDYLEASTLQTSGGNLLVAKDGYTDMALVRISAC